ncbi:tRNA (guanine-N1)-methyltransferase [Peptostreptococcus russellii]|uniref:tRNA (guanine-N(1)-)-methyltransferase n=1 Tax=Peptostreptococcus russellii TaxID=215200 RepID=A0A2P7Q180_9FIRM|nr:tRNA (guanosine(37)-N1)-methyltransferase TrmD [Peptostreptococcus russellii]PSJ31728.1 tRNA (guanine-N1)-methyltransferase [Peptostreptococcus russellii]
MKINVMTLFPEIFNSYIGESMMKKAVDNNILAVNIYNIRDFSENKHKKVDDYPFGGGAGMVMTPQPILSTYRHIIEENKLEKPRVIYLSPKGKTFTQDMAKSLSKEDNLIFLCGHYEGIDQRVIDMIVTDELSIGDYVLTGGELPALVMIDSISRLIPGVLNKSESYEDETFEGDLLEYPQYTRPREYEGHKVPDVILSGNHQKIDQWRKEESEKLTKERRPDLWTSYIEKNPVKEVKKNRRKRKKERLD